MLHRVFDISTSPFSVLQLNEGWFPCLAVLAVLIPRDINYRRNYCSIPFPFEVPLSAPTCLSLIYPFSVLVIQLLMFVRVTACLLTHRGVSMHLAFSGECCRTPSGVHRAAFSVKVQRHLLYRNSNQLTWKVISLLHPLQQCIGQCSRGTHQLSWTLQF